MAAADGKDDDDAVGSSVDFFKIFDYPTVSIYVHCRFPRPAGLLFGIGGIVSICFTFVKLLYKISTVKNVFYTNFVNPLDK